MDSRKRRNFLARPRKKLYPQVPINHQNIENRRKQSFIFWETLIEVYKECANESSIHGLKYTSVAKTRLERIFWLLILVASIVSAYELANKFYARHQEANMRTLVIDNQYPSWKIPLPAITICYPNLISRSRVVEFFELNPKLKLPNNFTMDDFIDNLQHLREMLNPTNQFQTQLQQIHEILVANNITVGELMSTISPRCVDLILTCRLEGKMRNCRSLLIRSVLSRGYCCSFNYIFTNEETRKKIPPELYSFNYGENFILSVLIKELSPYDRIANLLLGDGFKVIIHNRFAYPGTVAQEFVASIGYETIARLYPRRITATKDVLERPLSARKCYMTLKNSLPYKMDNCLVKCREKMLLKLCGCLPFYSSINRYNSTICDLTAIPCLARVKISVLSLTPWSKSCNCYPDCEEDTFTVDVTTLPMDAPQFNPSPFYQIGKDYPQATAVHITFAEQTCMLQRREIVLSWINLVSSLGGVFSLFLGCSFISLIELFYFIGYFIFKVRQKKKLKKNIRQRLF